MYSGTSQKSLYTKIGIRLERANESGPRQTGTTDDSVMHLWLQWTQYMFSYDDDDDDDNDNGVGVWPKSQGN